MRTPIYSQLPTILDRLDKSDTFISVVQCAFVCTSTLTELVVLVFQVYNECALN